MELGPNGVRIAIAGRGLVRDHANLSSMAKFDKGLKRIGFTNYGGKCGYVSFSSIGTFPLASEIPTIQSALEQVGLLGNTTDVLLEGAPPVRIGR